MRILFDSKNLTFKDPFGTLTPGQDCTLNIHIPASVGTTGVDCIFLREDSSAGYTFPMSFHERSGAYELFQCTFSLPETGLFFYYFRIYKKDGSFRLFKQGDGTNMEAGDY